MQSKDKGCFQAVAYMRQVRNDLSALFQTDKKRFHDELQQTMADFIAQRQAGIHLNEQKSAAGVV